MALTDQELIEKAKAGDKQAFTELFDRYRNRILGYLYRYVGNYHTAEDLTVTTFWNVYNNLPRYEERGQFSSWLYRIATNCAKRELENKSRDKEVSPEEPLVDGAKDFDLREIVSDETKRPDCEARGRELKEFIYSVVGRLEKKYKDVLLLCVVEGLEYKEAARILKCHPITIGTRLRRGRKMLYDILKKNGYEL
jgi:RNA polymerase sigma-70 factor, ECF subfamily